MDQDEHHPEPFTWQRDSVVNCTRCSKKKSRHVHCPCPICKNKAVSRTTEIKHWKDACDLQRQYEQRIQSEQANNIEKSYFPPVVPDEVDHTSDESDSTSSNTINPNELEPKHSHRENIRQ